LKTAFFIPICVVMLAVAPLLARAEEGWTCLFDGKTLDGWKASENSDSWKVEDGKLVCFGPRSHLFYTGELAPFVNFEFKAQVMTTPGSNSGIYIHTRYQEEGWPKYGYEVQVNNTHKDPKKTGGLYSVQDVFDAPAKDNEWFEMHIVVKGKQVTVCVDGKKLVDYTEPPGEPNASGNFIRVLDKGTIALQAHDPQSKVFYKDLHVKKLP
jgi:hypothetical protein